METNFDIEKYIENLPEKTQDFIGDTEWQNRVDEVAKKYNLNTEQIESLKDDVLLMIIGIGDPNKFQSVISQDLGVSDLVSEQILSDLEKRVFEYALKILEVKQKPSVPEIRPENVPAVKTENKTEDRIEKKVENKIGIPRYIPTQKSGGSAPQTSAVESPNETSRINYAKTTPVEPKKEPVVPRFNMAGEKPVTEPKPVSIIDEKLNTVTSGITEEPAKQASPIVKSYSVDPYREPLE